MRLLSKTTAQQKIQKNNDELIETNLRLRKYESQITQRLNNVKDSYEPDKLAKLKEFERFCKDLMDKKSKLLQELSAIETAISQKKELYYSLITKQDVLEEKAYQMNQREINLNMREVFVEDLEQKWRAKTVISN